MISDAMAVASAQILRSERAEEARTARFARAGALVADTLVLGLVTLVVNGVYGVTQVTSGSFVTSGLSTYTSSTTVAWPWLTLLGIVYFTLFEGMFGATPGKAWARLRVVRVDGSPLDLRAIVVRNLLKPIDYLPILYLLGGVSLLLTANSQRLGDLAAGTTVVYRHRALEPGATRSAAPAARGALAAGLLVAVLFTLAFDYFGRPPLMVEGLFNEHRLMQPDVTSYQLGGAQWSAGRVSYPFTIDRRTETCTGTLDLHWYWIAGWQLDGSSYVCPS